MGQKNEKNDLKRVFRRHRGSLRLRGYDYTRPGAYFVTICTKNRDCLFGEISNGKMILNEYGDCVKFTWHDLPSHSSNIKLDAFVIISNLADRKRSEGAGRHKGRFDNPCRDLAVSDLNTDFRSAFCMSSFYITQSDTGF